jgi:hypothetical protein
MKSSTFELGLIRYVLCISSFNTTLGLSKTAILRDFLRGEAYLELLKRTQVRIRVVQPQNKSDRNKRGSLFLSIKMINKCTTIGLTVLKKKCL